MTRKEKRHEPKPADHHQKHVKGGGGLRGGLGNGEPAFKARNNKLPLHIYNNNESYLQDEKHNNNHHHDKANKVPKVEFDDYYSNFDGHRKNGNEGNAKPVRVPSNQKGLKRQNGTMVPSIGMKLGQSLFDLMMWMLCSLSIILVFLFLQEIFRQNLRSPQNNTSTHQKKNKGSKKNKLKHKLDDYEMDDDYYHYDQQLYQQQNNVIIHDLMGGPLPSYEYSDSSMYYRPKHSNHVNTTRRRASTLAPVVSRAPPPPPSEPLARQHTQQQHLQVPGKIRTLRMNSATANQSQVIDDGLPPMTNKYVNLNSQVAPNLSHNHRSQLEKAHDLPDSIDIEFGCEDNKSDRSFKIEEQNNDSNLADEISLTEVIGSGGFGNVMRGNWRGTPVAVKILVLKDRLDDTTCYTDQEEETEKEKINTFQSEINILRTLRHPNICQFLGFYHKTHEWGLVMELCENGSVWDALRQSIKVGSFGLIPTGAPINIWPSKLILQIASGAGKIPLH